MTSIQNADLANNSLLNATDSEASTKQAKSKIPYRSILILSSTFLMFLVILYSVYSNFPQLDEWVRLLVKMRLGRRQSSVKLQHNPLIIQVPVNFDVLNQFKTRSEKEHVKLPRNIADAKQLGIILKKYKEDNYFSVLVAFFSTYIL